MKKFKEFINEHQEEIQFGQQTFTRAEVISLLEDVYMEVAGDYNDYGRRAKDYKDAAVQFVENFMKDR